MVCLEDPNLSEPPKIKPHQLESNINKIDKKNKKKYSVHEKRKKYSKIEMPKTEKSGIYAKMEKIFGDRLKITSESLRLNEKTPFNLKSFIVSCIHTIIPIISVIAVFLIIREVTSYDIGIQVKIDGENFGIVQKISDIEDIVTLMENDISSVLDIAYSFTHKINYKLIPIKTAVFLTEKEIRDKIYPLSDGVVVTAYGLYIDDILMGIADTREKIDAALYNVCLANTDDENNIRTEYVNDIRITEQKYSKDLIMSQDEIEAVLGNATSADTITTSTMVASPLSEDVISEDIVSGDRILYNSEAYEFIFDDTAVPAAKPDELLYNNSVIDVNINSAVTSAIEEAEKSNSISRRLPEAVSIEIKKKVYASVRDIRLDNMSNVTSLLNTPTEIIFRTVKEEKYSQVIKFDTEYRDSDKYYIGTSITLVEGEYGIKELTDEVSYIGETETERTTVSEKILHEALNRVIIRGSLEKPKPVPTGSFSMPVRPNYIGGGFEFDGEHRGIDYIANSGTPIYASDGGTVAYAGSGEGTPFESYGIFVRIIHADGMETIYAHMSEETVFTGQKVFKGQVIGKVGSTGNSTGPHLHFEMFRNGSLVNPADYMN